MYIQTCRVSINLVFDAEGKGVVTTDDLVRVMTNINGDSDSEFIEELIREADIDGDGKINFRGFHRI